MRCLDSEAATLADCAEDQRTADGSHRSQPAEKTFCRHAGPRRHSLLCGRRGDAGFRTIAWCVGRRGKRSKCADCQRSDLGLHARSLVSARWSAGAPSRSRWNTAAMHRDADLVDSQALPNWALDRNRRLRRRKVVLDSRTSSSTRWVAQMPTSAPITTIREFEAIKANLDNQGKVFEVTQEVFEHYAAKLFIRPINDQEKQEVSQLLGQRIVTSQCIGLTRTFSCPSCLYEFTFADHIRAAINMGVHTPDELAKFTICAERSVSYLVVDTDKGREVKCVSCGNLIIAPHCCYATSCYAYV